jgi:hypothetical protein
VLGAAIATLVTEIISSIILVYSLKDLLQWSWVPPLMLVGGVNITFFTFFHPPLFPALFLSGGIYCLVLILFKVIRIEEIKKLHKLGWEIGYHSNSHANLIDLGNKELKREIVDGKENLEEKLGFELKYFSYPKGKYNQKVVNMVMGAGFDAAFTVEAGPIGNKKYLLPRFQIEKLDNMNILALKLSLPGLFLERAVSNFFRIKEQMHVRFS